MRLARPCMLLAAAVCATVLLSAELPKTGGWSEVRTTHFTVYGSAGGRETKKIAVELERFREVLGRITKGLELGAETPTAFHVFRNDGQLTPYKPVENGQPRSLSGYFARRPFRNYVALDASANEGMRVVYHEYVHAVLDRTFPRLPDWLNEGLAEYYSTFRFNALSNDAEIGGLIPEHVHTLSMLPAIDVSLLLTMDAPSHAGGGLQDVFYAESWWLVHYLITDEGRRARLGHLLGLLRDGRAPDEAVKAALDPDPQLLQQELAQYFKSGGSRFTMRFDEPIEKERAERREMPPGEVLYRLGDLLAQLGPEQAAAARAHLEAALEQGGPAAGIHAAMGSAAEAAEDFAEADRQYRLAAAVEGAGAEVLARRGRFLLERSLQAEPSADDEADPPQGLLEARGLLARAVELDPECVDALVALAQSYLFGSGEVADGLHAVGRAHALRPDRVDVLLALAGLLARSGRTDAAWVVVKQELEPRATDAAEVRVAEGWIVEAEGDTIEELVRGGDLDAAAARLAELEGRVGDATLRARLASYRRRLADPAGVTIVAPQDEATAAGTQRLVDDYNRAVELANAGKTEQALAQLERLLERCTEEALCAAAREAAASMRSMVAYNRTVERVNEAIALANAGKRKEAIARLREAEGTCQDPQLAERIRDLLVALGAR